MENRDRTRDQGGSDKPTTRPTPSGVPNEGRGTEDHHGNLDQGARTGQGDYEYKGGRQGTGGIPSPDDSDDQESASSFRGTSEQKSEADGEDDDEHSEGARRRRNQDLNSQPRNPK